MPRINALPPILLPAADDALPIVDQSEATTKKVTLGMIMPTGAVMDFAGGSPPVGWLLCYGQTLNATSNPEYAALFAAIGTTFGGSGITSFMVPDARGRITAGADAMGGTAANRLTTASLGVAAVRGAVGGAQTHTLNNTQLPNITGSIGLHGSAGGSEMWQPTGVFGNSPQIGQYRSQGTATGGASSMTGLDFATGGGGQAHNNVQPTLILNKIIKY